MSNNFPQFSKKVNDNFKAITASGKAFVTDSSFEEMKDVYLAAFPDGTNPIFITNTEHHCSCCFSFLKHIGSVVQITDDLQIKTVWDNCEDAPYPYNIVAKAMSDYVKSCGIESVFALDMHKVSTEKNLAELKNGTVVTFHHFHAEVPDRYFSTSVGSIKGDFDAKFQVLKRGLEELSTHALQDIIGYMESGAVLYKDNHFEMVKEFVRLQKAYKSVQPKQRDLFAVKNADSFVAKFRDSSIGELAVKLSADGCDVDAKRIHALREYNRMVDPMNYQRATAPITAAQVKAFDKVAAEYGVQYEGRMATLADIPVSQVLFADRSVSGSMKGGKAAALLAGNIVSRKPKSVANAGNSIELNDFLNNVLPASDSVEVFVDTKHSHKFMTLTAGTQNLLAWANGINWAYANDAVDSIKKLVEAKGGKTDGVMNWRLAWGNYNDYDAHLRCPDGSHVYCFDRQGCYSKLDVDENAGSGKTRTPVENITSTRLVQGDYTYSVHNYSLRERVDTWCIVELDLHGQVTRFYRDTIIDSQEEVKVATVTVDRNGTTAVSKVYDGWTTEQPKTVKFGISTGEWHRASIIMQSPNWWGDDKIGSRHLFFILNGCKNEEPVRCFYTEQVRSELKDHRKVLEPLGAKTKADPIDGQLSGVGFSSAVSDEVTVRVTKDGQTKQYTIVM